MQLRLQFEDRQGRVFLTGQNFIRDHSNHLDIVLIVKIMRGGRTFRVRVERFFRIPFFVERRRQLHFQDQWHESDDEWEQILSSSDSDDSDEDAGQDNAAQPNGGMMNGGN
jgi:hypothetical protein